MKEIEKEIFESGFSMLEASSRAGEFDWTRAKEIGEKLTAAIHLWHLKKMKEEKERLISFYKEAYSEAIDLYPEVKLVKLAAVYREYAYLINRSKSELSELNKEIDEIEKL